MMVMEFEYVLKLFKSYQENYDLLVGKKKN